LGNKLDSREMPLYDGSGVRCNIVFSAGPGESAGGLAGQPSSFASALCEVLTRNAYTETSDGWVVRADVLQTALQKKLEFLYNTHGVYGAAVPVPEFR
jgi:hypothetical protein